jgi:hypothetical protein
LSSKYWSSEKLTPTSLSNIVGACCILQGKQS